MAHLLGDVHIWSSRNLTNISDDNIGFFSYNNKDLQGIYVYYDEKRQYTESRDTSWTLRNKRPERLKDTLKDLEDVFASHQCVKSYWITPSLLQMILSNGWIVTIQTSLHTGDIDKLLIDKSLVGKLSSTLPSDAFVAENFLALAYPDKVKLDYIFFNKKLQGETPQKYNKLSALDPKVVYVELPGPLGRRLERNISCNRKQELVCCWWPIAIQEAWPWSPMAGEKEHANVVIYSVAQTTLPLVTFFRTEGNPFQIQFSLYLPTRLYSVEQSTNSKHEHLANFCTYEILKGKIHRRAVTTIPLKSSITCQARSAMEDCIVIGCNDGSLVMYDDSKKKSRITSAIGVPHCLSWHPSCALFAASTREGEIQIFDRALGSLLFQLVAENMNPAKSLPTGSFFKQAPLLDSLEWSPEKDMTGLTTECFDSLLLVYSRGPIGIVRFHTGALNQGVITSSVLVNNYLKYNQTSQAVNLLCSLNWNEESDQCFSCMTYLCNYLLRQPLNPETEGQIEGTLGSFYNPLQPLTEAVILEFREHIGRFARRFFHLLLRYSRFEKAYLLAIDIGAHDLFMDLHYLALEKGESVLAAVCKEKADELDVESLDEYSDSDDYSDDGDGQDYNDFYEQSLDEFYYNGKEKMPGRRVQTKVTSPSALSPSLRKAELPPADALRNLSINSSSSTAAAASHLVSSPSYIASQGHKASAARLPSPSQFISPAYTSSPTHLAAPTHSSSTTRHATPIHSSSPARHATPIHSSSPARHAPPTHSSSPAQHAPPTHLESSTHSESMTSPSDQHIRPGYLQLTPQAHSSPLPGHLKGYINMPEAALQKLEEDLTNEIHSEFTAALLDEIPPPQLQDGERRIDHKHLII